MLTLKGSGGLYDQCSWHVFVLTRVTIEKKKKKKKVQMSSKRLCVFQEPRTWTPSKPFDQGGYN